MLIPGDPEAMARANRSLNGVPLDQETIDQLIGLGEKVGVPFPASVESRS